MQAPVGIDRILTGNDGLPSSFVLSFNLGRWSSMPPGIVKNFARAAIERRGIIHKMK
jgi:hypothetical protein